ncbi:MAG: hypothetical protein CMN26_11015 [Salinisphaera sp.]|nr:hypothetical protein [Salinisphaera sp.]
MTRSPNVGGALAQPASSKANSSDSVKIRDRIETLLDHSQKMRRLYVTARRIRCGNPYFPRQNNALSMRAALQG